MTNGALYSIADLTAELGQTPDRQNAVAAFTGEVGLDSYTEKVFTRDWMDEMVKAWNLSPTLDTD